MTREKERERKRGVEVRLKKKNRPLPSSFCFFNSLRVFSSFSCFFCERLFFRESLELP